MATLARRIADLAATVLCEGNGPNYGPSLEDRILDLEECLTESGLLEEAAEELFYEKRPVLQSLIPNP